YYALPDFQRAQMSNPMVAIENEAQHNIAQNYRMSGNVYGEVNFIPELTFRAAFSLDYASNNSRQFSPVRAHYVPEDGKVHNTSDIEKISQSKANTMVAQSDYVLTYKNTFAEKHNLTLTAGLTTNYISSESMTMGRSQDVTKADILIPNDPDKWWVSSIGDISSSTNSGAQYRRFTLFRALYNYDNRYLLNASFRRDGASVFRYTGNTWDNFYSVGAGWVMSEENFMKKQNVINYLKFKGSYGVLGNQNTGTAGGNYPAFPTLNSSNAVFGDNVMASYSQAYLVSNLRWEKTSAWEVGFEMQLLSNRLRIEPIYYRQPDLLPRKIHGCAGWSDQLG
ncbi:MAG: SusC/RagA family protein, partial [Alistipes sp.]